MIGVTVKSLRPGWGALLKLPLAILLGILVGRNYRKRLDGKLPDKWYWADKLLLRLGFAATVKWPLT